MTTIKCCIRGKKKVIKKWYNKISLNTSTKNTTGVNMNFYLLFKVICKFVPQGAPANIIIRSTTLQVFPVV